MMDRRTLQFHPCLSFFSIFIFYFCSLLSVVLSLSSLFPSFIRFACCFHLTICFQDAHLFTFHGMPSLLFACLPVTIPAHLPGEADGGRVPPISPYFPPPPSILLRFVYVFSHLPLFPSFHPLFSVSSLISMPLTCCQSWLLFTPS